MYFHDYTKEETVAVAKQLKDYSLGDCIKDYNRLRDGFSAGLDTIAPLSLVGIKFIEHFIYPELLNTKTKQGISFYDFWYNKDFYMTRDASTKNLIEYIKKEKPKLGEIKRAKKVFNLYYGSINVLRPTIALRLYDLYKPSCVLDFTMGWGGRLVGACIAGVPKYIGIDTNRNLEAPYKNMCEQLKKLSPCTDAQLLFVDALTVDYSTFEYDMVFTSPPYYNKEIYGQGFRQGFSQGFDKKEEPLALGQSFVKKVKTEDEWNEQFYLPLFKKTWANLKVGGHYCLNVPSQLYDKICEPLLGPAQEQMELKKFARTLPDRDTARKNVGQKYKEFIYIWIKK